MKRRRVFLYYLASFFTFLSTYISTQPLPHIKLESINLSEMHLHKTSIRRKIYFDPTQQYFYKIWNSDYADAKNFISALLHLKLQLISQILRIWIGVIDLTVTHCLQRSAFLSKNGLLPADPLRPRFMLHRVLIVALNYQR